MRTILITIPEASAARNLFRGSFWQIFKQEKDAKIILVTLADKFDHYRKEFGGYGREIVVESIPLIVPGFFDKTFAFFARNALKTGTVTFNQMRQYYSGGKRISLIFKRVLWHFLGHSKLFQEFLRHLELTLSPHTAVRGVFDKYKPDLVFTTITIHPEVDVPILREAKRRKIKTIGMLRGWDNFTSHGFLRVVPDRMLLQNKFLKDMGMKYQFLSPERLEIVGFPQNDWYFKKDLIEPRAKFLARLGINPKKRMILFGAMGDFLFPQEGELAKVFEELVETKKVPEDLVFVFRAHPAFVSPLEYMKKLKHVVPDRNAMYHSAHMSDWEMGEQEMAYLVNSIVHSDMMITSGSTMALDGVALGRPAISVAFELTKMPYWFSAQRFRDNYTHYEYMMVTGGVARADSFEELAKAINAYLENPSQDLEGRKKLTEEFLEPYDGHSGERIAKKVTSALFNKFR